MFCLGALSVSLTTSTHNMGPVKASVAAKAVSATAASSATPTTKNSKQTKMPTPQEMQELYDKITPLQKIVTLQHIYSLYMAAAQQSEKKEVSFNIIQLQRMINSNPLVNPDFNFLDITGFLNINKEKGKDKGKDKSSNNSNNSSKGPVSPVQLIQILTESLTLRDERGRNEQVIQQIPNTMLFKLSKFIDLNFVKDRLIKLLNAYKNSTLKEIEELENKWKTKKSVISKIEEGKMDDSVLYEEFLKDLKRKRGPSSVTTKDKVVDPKKTTVKPLNVGGNATAAISTSVSNSTSSSPSPSPGEIQGKKLQISRNINKIVEKSSKEIIPNIKSEENKDVFIDASESVEQREESAKQDEVKSPGKRKHEKAEEGENIEDSPSKRLKKEKETSEPIEEPIKTRTRTRSMVSNEIAAKAGNKKFQQLSIQLITNISSHRIASMFLNPVNSNDEPQYYKLIKKPIDLKTIVKRIKAGNIATIDELELEMQIMFTNAIMYNDMNQSDVYNSILDMMKEWESLLSMLKENM